MNATGVNCKSSAEVFEGTRRKHSSAGVRWLITGKYQQLMPAT
jgi:hypothetical protein